MPLVSFAPPPLCLSFLSHLLPSLPPPVRDVDVPPLLRRRFILSGYRPPGLPLRCYILSLLQIHNQTLNVWSHLLAAVCITLRFTMFAVLRGGGILGFRLQGPEGQGFSLDAASLPLVLYVFSAVMYLSFSAAAHLFQSHSEQLHDWFIFLDSVGVAVFQYGCALALSVYSADAAWTQSMLGKVFLPGSALLAWLSFAACCYAKLHFHRLDPLNRKFVQLVPTSAGLLLVIGPLTQRLTAQQWSPAVMLHLLQVALFLLSFFFFSCPVPECFAPGRYDIIGHAHQLSHILSALGTLVQQEALFHDFLWRRPTLIRRFGEQRLLLVCSRTVWSRRV
ncbi:membrane progestin receptor beta-like [Acanthochromis polyacanthus]|uniref:membrane progestin receptor beta-like n=1 Tax=Acanthochromis polyacanthus TaxID=80966 RepID=UPI0022348FDE|nr:membrane progestin receptor beta-like [Acanthochromis polyacanthus]